MPIWDIFIRRNNTSSADAGKFALVDAEIGVKDHKVHDIGALRFDGAQFHQASKDGLKGFLKGVDYICGHNIVHHDAIYLSDSFPPGTRLVDTLYVSPLLFPERPYHKLVKDDKLVSDDVNNPLNDCEKAHQLLWDEVARWKSIPVEEQRIFTSLLLIQVLMFSGS